MSAQGTVAPDRVRPAPSGRTGWLTRKRLFQIHGWLGITFGLPLFIICFSGAAAALSHEIDWLLNPAIRVTPSGAMRGWNDWRKAADAARPDWRIRWISAPLNRFSAVEVMTEAPSGQWRRIYVNPYTGDVQGTSSFFNVQRFLRDFHRMLNLSSTGLLIVSGFGFVLLTSVLSGFLFYRNWWRHLFQLRLRKGWRAIWSDTHRLIGVWSLWFGLLIAITGIWYFIEQITFMRAVTPVEDRPRLSPSDLAAHGPLLRVVDLDAVVAHARQALPGLEVRTVWFPMSPIDALRVDGQATAWLVRDRANSVLFDGWSGRLLHVQRAEQLGAYERWQDTADPLHFGDFGGLPTKILWSLLGFTVPVLILTGAWFTLREGYGPRSAAKLLWAVPTVALLGFSAYASIGAVTRYRTTTTSSFGPSQRVELAGWPLLLSRSRREIRVGLDCADCAANFRALTAAIGGAKPGALRLRAGAWYLPAESASPAVSLTVTDWNGERHTATVRLSASAEEMRQTESEGPFTGPGVAPFLTALIAVLIGISIGWLWRVSIGRTHAVIRR